MNAEQPIVGADAQRPWLVANVLAFIVGGGLAGGALRYLEQPYYGADVSAIAAASIQAMSAGVSGAIFGAVLGALQWPILRGLFRAGWWAPRPCGACGEPGSPIGMMRGACASTVRTRRIRRWRRQSSCSASAMTPW